MSCNKTHERLENKGTSNQKVALITQRSRDVRKVTRSEPDGRSKRSLRVNVATLPVPYGMPF